MTENALTYLVIVSIPFEVTVRGLFLFPPPRSWYCERMNELMSSRFGFTGEGTFCDTMSLRSVVLFEVEVFEFCELSDIRFGFHPVERVRRSVVRYIFLQRRVGSLRLRNIFIVDFYTAVKRLTKYKRYHRGNFLIVNYCAVQKREETSTKRTFQLH